MHPLTPRQCGTKGLPQGCSSISACRKASGSGMSSRKPAASQNSANEAQGSSSSVRVVTMRSAAFPFASSLCRMYSANLIGHWSTVVALTVCGEDVNVITILYLLLKKIRNNNKNINVRYRN